MPGRSSPSIPSLASARHGNQRYNYQSLPRYPSGRIIRRTPELEANRLPPIGENGPAAEELPQHWIWSYLTPVMKLANCILGILGGFLLVVILTMGFWVIVYKLLVTIFPPLSTDEPINSWMDYKGLRPRGPVYLWDSDDAVPYSLCTFHLSIPEYPIQEDF